MGRIPKEIIAMDFDGTIVEPDNFPGFGKPKKEVIAKIIMKQRAGASIILWTCREGRALRMAIDFCEEQGIELAAVNENHPEWIRYTGENSRKIFAHTYLDDRASSIEDFLWGN